jgi:hypothetical protein
VLTWCVWRLSEIEYEVLRWRGEELGQRYSKGIMLLRAQRYVLVLTAKAERLHLLECFSCVCAIKGEVIS